MINTFWSDFCILQITKSDIREPLSMDPPWRILGIVGIWPGGRIGYWIFDCGCPWILDIWRSWPAGVGSWVICVRTWKSLKAQVEPTWRLESKRNSSWQAESWWSTKRISCWWHFHQISISSPLFEHQNYPVSDLDIGYFKIWRLDIGHLKIWSLDIGHFEFCAVGQWRFGCAASSNIQCGGSNMISMYCASSLFVHVFVKDFEEVLVYVYIINLIKRLGQLFLLLLLLFNFSHGLWGLL